MSHYQNNLKKNPKIQLQFLKLLASFLMLNSEDKLKLLKLKARNQENNVLEKDQTSTKQNLQK